MNGPTSEKLRDPALVDFSVDASGRGRRLERLAGILVDRPLPQAEKPRRRPAAWAEAAAIFRSPRGDRGRWPASRPAAR